MEKQFFITKNGLQKIKKEYQLIKQIVLANKKEGLPTMPDSASVDGEYISFWENMAFLEKRLLEIKDFLQKAVLIRTPDDKNVVALGATVLVQTGGNSKEKLTIVGTQEADPSQGFISHESPVGKSLLGHKLNEEIKVFKNLYKIKEIKYNDALLVS